MKKEKTEAGIPSYMRSTASFRAMDQTRPLKKEEKKMVVPLRKLYMKSDDPDDSVPIHPSMAKKASHEVKETSQEEEKRCPHYLSATVASRARDMPTREYVKRESRLPPRMVLRKRTMSSAEASEEEKKISSGPGKSISSSPECRRRHSSRRRKRREEKRKRRRRCP